MDPENRRPPDRQIDRQSGQQSSSSRDSQTLLQPSSSRNSQTLLQSSSSSRAPQTLLQEPDDDHEPDEAPEALLGTGRRVVRAVRGAFGRADRDSHENSDAESDEPYEALRLRAELTFAEHTASQRGRVETIAATRPDTDSPPPSEADEPDVHNRPSTSLVTAREPQAIQEENPWTRLWVGPDSRHTVIAEVNRRILTVPDNVRGQIRLSHERIADVFEAGERLANQLGPIAEKIPCGQRNEGESSRAHNKWKALDVACNFTFDAMLRQVFVLRRLRSQLPLAIQQDTHAEICGA